MVHGSGVCELVLPWRNCLDVYIKDRITVAIEVPTRCYRQEYSQSPDWLTRVVSAGLWSEGTGSG